MSTDATRNPSTLGPLVTSAPLVAAISSGMLAAGSAAGLLRPMLESLRATDATRLAAIAPGQLVLASSTLLFGALWSWFYWRWFGWQRGVTPARSVRIAARMVLAGAMIPSLVLNVILAATVLATAGWLAQAAGWAGNLLWTGFVAAIGFGSGEDVVNPRLRGLALLLFVPVAFAGWSVVGEAVGVLSTLSSAGFASSPFRDPVGELTALPVVRMMYVMAQLLFLWSIRESGTEEGMRQNPFGLRNTSGIE